MGKDKHNVKKSKKYKKEKKAKRKHSKEKKKRRRSNSDSSSNSDDWVEKSVVKPDDSRNKKDDFSFLASIPTYNKKGIEDEKRIKKEKKNIDDYNPSTSTRELNPYWKDGGKGLPMESAISDQMQSFKRPHDDMETEPTRKTMFRRPNDDFEINHSWKFSQSSISHQRTPKNWKKRDEVDKEERNDDSIQTNIEVDNREVSKVIRSADGFLTDQEMNALGAKIVKAEILGNKTLAAELNAKLQRARECKTSAANEGDKIMLTVSDSKGNVRPLTKTENASASRGNKRRSDTHSKNGKRDKYFADDDKYCLDKMFINEKYESGERDERQFMKAVAKHSNPNDDLDDIFEDNITMNKSDVSSDERAKNKAITEHKRLEKSMESCNRCIDSGEMKKHLITSMTGHVYLCVPETKSLTEGHCIISTTHHLPCATMLDEDIWEEITDYRKAITRMFESQDKDVVFFETVKNLHWRPHFTLHCIPMPRDVGDTAAIYFKKAISECEMEWSTNKKVVDLKGPDVRRGIPKGLPYFWVHFGMDLGFAHVIEDARLFPDKFAEEILGGILDLDHRAWRKPFKENFENQLKKVKEFMAMWKPYEEYVKH